MTSIDALTPIVYELQVFSLTLVLILVIVRVLAVLVHAVRPAGVREEKVHDSATCDALAVRCSHSDSAMSAQPHGGTAHISPCVAIAHATTGELVAMIVEEPLPSRVNPSGRLDLLLRAHPPLIQPSLAEPLVRTATMRLLATLG